MIQHKRGVTLEDSFGIQKGDKGSDCKKKAALMGHHAPIEKFTLLKGDRTTQSNIYW